MGSRAPKRAFPKDRAQRLCGAKAKAKAPGQTVPLALYKKELTQERGGREISLPPLSCALRLSAKRAASRTPGAILRGMAGALATLCAPDAQFDAAPCFDRSCSRFARLCAGAAPTGKEPFLPTAPQGLELSGEASGKGLVPRDAPGGSALCSCRALPRKGGKGKKFLSLARGGRRCRAGCRAAARAALA